LSTRITPDARSALLSRGAGPPSPRSTPRKHAEALFEGSNGDEVRDRVWTYLFIGPYKTLADFAADIKLKSRSVDPHFFAVVDNASGRAIGYQALMRIDPTHRVIEVGNIMYTPAMQRTPGATEAQYLSARYVFECSAPGATNGSATT
jgi:RimJ/RimL family protein N-acetyltransferase